MRGRERSPVAIMRDLIIPPSADLPASPEPDDSGSDEQEDVCRYLFELCKRLESTFLDRRGITCLFDVNSGWLAGSRCRILGLVVAALVIDIASHARVRPQGGTITVSAFSRGKFWYCSVSDSGVYAVRSEPSRPPDFVKRIAKKLGADLDHWATRDGAVTSFLFEGAPKTMPHDQNCTAASARRN